MTGPDNHYGYLGLRDGRSYVFPVSGSSAAQALEVYSAQTLKAQAGKRLLGLALRLGAGRYALPLAAIVDDTGNGQLLGYLRTILGQSDLFFSISLGVPGPHRKPVLQAITPDGVTLAYVKVGWNAISNNLVQRETDTLQLLNRLRLSAFVTPAVLHAGEWHGRFICAQSAPEQSASPPLTFGVVHRDIIRAMASHFEG